MTKQYKKSDETSIGFVVPYAVYAKAKEMAKAENVPMYKFSADLFTRAVEAESGKAGLERRKAKLQAELDKINLEIME